MGALYPPVLAVCATTAVPVRAKAMTTIDFSIFLSGAKSKESITINASIHQHHDLRLPNERVVCTPWG